MSSLISPMRFNATQLLDVSYEVNPMMARSCDDLLTGTRNKMAVAHKSRFKKEGEKLICKCILEAEIAIRPNEDSEEEAEDIATFSCTMSAQGSAPLNLYEDRSKSEMVLEANLISLIWGKIRGLLESLSVESQLGKRITLPAVDPYVLIERDSADDSDSENAE